MHRKLPKSVSQQPFGQVEGTAGSHIPGKPPPSRPPPPPSHCPLCALQVCCPPHVVHAEPIAPHCAWPTGSMQVPLSQQPLQLVELHPMLWQLPPVQV